MREVVGKNPLIGGEDNVKQQEKARHMMGMWPGGLVGMEVG